MFQSLEFLPWVIALLALAGAILVIAWARPRRSGSHRALPTDWNLAPRPVFNTDERRVYRQLREALPHHIILSKLPLVRFCQPNDPSQVSFWYRTLGTAAVSFAICSTNGRVLATVDLETERGESERRKQLKQSVMATCRIRYLRCPIDHLPSVAELQMLVPHSSSTRGPQASPERGGSRDARGTPRANRRPRSALWRDSSFFGDSFFAQEKRDDPNSTGFQPSQTDQPSSRPPAERDDPHRHRGATPDDIGGIVVDDDAESDDFKNKRDR